MLNLKEAIEKVKQTIMGRWLAIYCLKYAVDEQENVHIFWSDGTKESVNIKGCRTETKQRFLEYLESRKKR